MNIYLGGPVTHADLTDDFAAELGSAALRPPAFVRAVEPDLRAPPITKQKDALSPVSKKALETLNTMPPAQWDTQGRPVWRITATLNSGDTAERQLATLVERLGAARSIPGIFADKRSAQKEHLGGYRYTFTFTAGPLFAAYLAYPDRRGIKPDRWRGE